MSAEHPPSSGQRVAIILTCYNDGATLGETIASIRQEPSDVELVLVDDGSTDAETVAYLAHLEYEGVTVIRQPNQGQAAAAMTGVSASSAPYVMRFDSDDLLEPGAVTALADALETAPGAGVAWGDVQTFGLTDFRIVSPPELDPWLLTYTNCLTGSGNLLRRTALAESGGWQLREGFEDWDLWLSLAELGYSGIHVPRVVFHYRRDRGGRLAGWLPDAARHYDELRRRHEKLFASRVANRRRSAAPLALKVLVPAIEAVPWVSRLVKIHLCELFTRLFWAGGFMVTVRMARKALFLRFPHWGAAGRG